MLLMKTPLRAPAACLLLALLLSCANAFAELVRFPRHSADANPERYASELLRQALERSGGDFRLQATPQPMSPARALHALEQNDGSIQVLWAMATPQRQKKLLAIPIPIYQNLIGWRILLLRGKDKNRLADIKKLSSLGNLRFGQRSEWLDVEILRANGLSVQTSNSYPSLFSMLDAGRFDLLPLEVLVAAEEQQRFTKKGLDLALDDHLLLHYPSTYYYFTSRQNPQLAAAIRHGLEAMRSDGSLDRLFRKNFEKALHTLHLDKRQVIELSNPLEPEFSDIHSEPQQTPQPSKEQS